MRVERRWPGSTVFCLATGPSLTAADVDACKGRGPVIAVNDAYRVAPWADALVAADAAWWHAHEGVKGFAGEKWSVAHGSWRRYLGRWPDVTLLRHTGGDGIDTDPSGIRDGRNSGYLAIGLAVHYGASRIVLLGYDMGYVKGQPSHFFGDHPGALRQRSPFPLFLEKYQTAVAPLKALGIEIVNCSRRTALTCFPRRPLEDVIA